MEMHTGVNMSKLTLQLQEPVTGWNTQLQRAYAAGSPYAAIKSFHPENYSEAQAASPGIAYFFRHFDDNLQKNVILPMIYQGQYVEAADLWISQFRDSVNQHMGITPGRPVYVESMNEEWPTADLTKLLHVIQFDMAFIDRLPLFCPGVRPAVFTAAIGNPEHFHADKLLPLAAKCAQAKGAMCYHMYHSVYNGSSFVNSYPHQLDLHLRWALSFDEYFVAHGVRVDWYPSEAGAIGCEPSGYGPKPLDGWKLSSVWNSNIQAYIADLAALDQVLASTRAGQEGRLIGVSLFISTPFENDWKYFNIKDAMLSALTDYVIANPSPTPTPPPTPQRARGLDISHWQGSFDGAVAYSRGVRFIFIKATEGATYKDPKYQEFTAEAEAHNILHAPYHFYSPGVDPLVQADHLYNTTVGDIQIRPVVDVEESPTLVGLEMAPESEPVESGYGHMGYFQQEGTEVLDAFSLIDPELVTAFAQEVRLCGERLRELTGLVPLLYTNTYFYNTYLASANLNEVYDLIIAQWANVTEPTIPSDFSNWDFWQYTNSLNGPEWGVGSLRVDGDVFNGDEAALLAYANVEPEPVPVPEPANLLLNHSFENGYYMQYPQYKNILVPTDWIFYFAAPTVPNPYSSDPDNVFGQPELMPLHRKQIPDDEEDDFFWDGDYTLKLFAGSRAWQATLAQIIPTPVQAGKFKVNIFVDCYTAIVGGQKVWATDPDTCLIVPVVNGKGYGEPLRLQPGMRHTVTFNIDLGGVDIFRIALKVIAPFATLNNGVFIDDLSFVEAVPLGPFPVYASTISLVPPTKTSTAQERQTVIDWAIAHEETLAWSAHDCVKLVLSGLAGTVRVWYYQRWENDIVYWLKYYGVQNVELRP